MSFKFSGISGKKKSSKQPDTLSTKQLETESTKQPNPVTSDLSAIEPSLNDEEISSVNAEDLLSSIVIEEELEDGSRPDDDKPDCDDVSVITTASTKSKKKLDVEIQADVWNMDLKKLNDFKCNCEERACTQNATINQVVHTRESLWGKGMVTSKMRRKMIFTMVASARLTKTRELRFVSTVG